MPVATLAEMIQTAIPAGFRARYELTPGTPVARVDESGTIAGA